jgi:ubiquinone/menaquinone biosynthesis C-methylase UbiE
MSLRPGMRVLDVGCGVGGPAREIARFSDAKIVGLNNNDFQIGRARKYTKAAGLEDQVQFVKGDFMKLSEQFGENAFDAGALSSLLLCVGLFYLIYLFIQYMPSRLQFMPRHGKAFTARY